MFKTRYSHVIRFALLLTVAIATIAIASGTGSPKEAARDPDVMRVTKLQVVHEGAVVAEVSASPEGDGQLILYDRDGGVLQSMPFRPHIRFIDRPSPAVARDSAQGRASDSQSTRL